MRSIARNFVLGLLLFATYEIASAEIPIPILNSAKFDSQGRLVVKVSSLPIEGCYVTVNGGLSSHKIDTAIVGIVMSASDAEKKSVTIRTMRKYFCKRRTLYVNVESVCLNTEIGQTNSKVKSVAVPDTNFKR